jgi:hypothetical protein
MVRATGRGQNIRERLPGDCDNDCYFDIDRLESLDPFLKQQ